MLHVYQDHNEFRLGRESIAGCRELYKEHRGVISGGCSYVSNLEFFGLFHDEAMDVKWVPDCLRRSPTPMLLDELSSYDISHIGAAADGDVAFRTWLIQEIASYRSPFPTEQAFDAVGCFESTFGVSSVVRSVWKLNDLSQKKSLARFMQHWIYVNTSSITRVWQ